MAFTQKLKQHLTSLGVDVGAVEQALPNNLTLSFQDGVLSLYDLNNTQSHLCVDYVEGALSYRSRQHLGAENLIKACQIKGQPGIRILDGTCGLGTDSFLLHQAGFAVTATEKNPIIHALLLDGINRYTKQTGNGCFELNLADLTDQLQSHQYDVIYLDPMFPTKEKSAKNKKTMQLFQAIHEDEVDTAAQFLDLALHACCQRVVIKRPTKAPILTQTKPTFQVMGKTCRFDAYHIS
ncbi:MAG: class I SAM-dependent methyltransferase [Marinicella sp.]